MLGPVDWDNTILFVEYGPGVGTFTRPILENAPSRCDSADDRHQPRFHRVSQGIDRRRAAGRGHRIGRRRREDPRRPRVRARRLRAVGDARSRRFRRASAKRSARRPPRSSARAARSWSTSSAPRCATSSSRISTVSSAVSNGSTSRRRRCSGRGRTRSRTDRSVAAEAEVEPPRHAIIEARHEEE